MRAALIRQRKELFAEAEIGYLRWEREALGCISAENDYDLARAAIRWTWLDWAGEAPDDWRVRLPPLVKATVESLAEGIAAERARAPWADEHLMRRTICVVQRRSLHRVTARKATRLLCRIEALVHQGVGK